jgi:hypothetical protein
MFQKAYVLSDADRAMDGIVKSFLTIFFGVMGVGIIALWFSGWNETIIQAAFPELLIGSFLVAVLSAVSIGVVLNRRNRNEAQVEPRKELFSVKKLYKNINLNENDLENQFRERS